MTTPKQQLIAPMSGKTMDLATVPDPVFSEKLTGDGLAIVAESDTVIAPCDGVMHIAGGQTLFRSPIAVYGTLLQIIVTQLNQITHTEFCISSNVHFILYRSFGQSQ